MYFKPKVNTKAEKSKVFSYGTRLLFEREKQSPPTHKEKPQKQMLLRFVDSLKNLDGLSL